MAFIHSCCLVWMSLSGPACIHVKDGLDDDVVWMKWYSLAKIE
jgi:hypothetical protein